MDYTIQALNSINCRRKIWTKLLRDEIPLSSTFNKGLTYFSCIKTKINS